MPESRRTQHIIVLLVQGWLLLLSFYWLLIGAAMAHSLPFFVVAVLSFLLVCGQVFMRMSGRKKGYRRLLAAYSLVTLSGILFAWVTDEACTCDPFTPLDLIPQGTGLVMALLLLFNRSV